MPEMRREFRNINLSRRVRPKLEKVEVDLEKVRFKPIVDIVGWEAMDVDGNKLPLTYGYFFEDDPTDVEASRVTCTVCIEIELDGQKVEKICFEVDCGDLPPTKGGPGENGDDDGEDPKDPGDGDDDEEIVLTP